MAGIIIIILLLIYAGLTGSTHDMDWEENFFYFVKPFCQSQQNGFFIGINKIKNFFSENKKKFFFLW